MHLVALLVALLVVEVAGFQRGFWRTLAASSGCSRLYAVEISGPDPSKRRIVSLFPIGDELPPLIYHVKADKACTRPTIEFLVQETELPERLVRDLIDFGAVYLQPRPEDKLRRMQAKDVNRKVTHGAYARVHVNPRRYPDYWSVSTEEWKRRCRRVGSDLLLLDKPPGSITLVPTVDNARENGLCGVEQAVAAGTTLLPCGRLDAGTSGLCLVAETSQAAKRVNLALQSGAILKEYIALCHDSSAVLPTGLLEHRFRKKTISHPNAKPTLLRASNSTTTADDGSEWQPAQLVVLSSRRLVLSQNQTSSIPAREVNIKLITGRTHQIRLQLAALGFPLVGDTRYIPVAGLLDDSTRGDGSGLFGPDPRSRVGLHCSSLTVPASVLSGIAGGEEELVQLKAEEPWWRE